MFDLIPFNRRNNVAPREEFFNNLLEPLFREDFFAPFTITGNSFRADLKEMADSYVVSADLPGVKKEDITIQFVNDYLTISAKRQEDTESKEENYLRRERRYGEFKRNFYVRNVVNEKIDAEFKDGVLTVVLPKRENTERTDTTIPIR